MALSTTRTRRIVAGAVSVVLAGALAPAMTGTATAGTGSNGPLSITLNDDYVRYGCFEYPLNYTITVPGDAHWNLDTAVKRPSGAETASSFDYGDGSKTGVDGVQMCESLDGPGTYQVESTLTVDDVKTVATTSFTLRQSSTTTTFKLAKKQIKRGKSVKASGSVTVGAGPYNGNPATERLDIQGKVKGKKTWKDIGSAYSDNTGKFKTKIQFINPKGSKVQYRAVLDTDGALLGSTSKAATLKVVGRR